MGRNEYTYKPGYNGTLQERMVQKTQINSPDECWPWTGSLDTAGYGCIRVGYKLCHATHIAYQFAYGQSVPKGKLVMHTCDNPRCVNPAHLQLGDKYLNSHDMLSKERGNKCCHGKHHRAKLTWEQVKAIRERYAQGNITFTALGNSYNISRTTIRRIVNYTSWH